MRILVLNAGSSSQKCSLYDLRVRLPEAPPWPDWEGRIEWDGGQSELQVATARGAVFKEHLQVKSHRQATEQLLTHLWSGSASVMESPSGIDIVGHRIVNGGEEYTEPTFITAETTAAIQRMSAFAPLHNSAELEGIEIVKQKVGAVPQVAVFDTGFHSRLPEAAAVYP